MFIFLLRQFFYAAVDPCKQNNGGCGHNCVKISGMKYNCSCDLGFKLESDLHNCTGKVMMGARTQFENLLINFIKAKAIGYSI